MASGGEIREGFLCPMCMKDLGTVTQLQAHFEEAHSTEDKVVLHQLCGLFDKAKRKILGEKEDDLEADSSSGKASSFVTRPSTSMYDVDYWEPQDIGMTRSQTDHFRSVRDTRVDKYVVETNKLLIRLDKLIGLDAPTDTGKRKAFEKGLVMWTPDNDVKSCPFCGRSFGLMRRRHHCRLCGGIMCDRCSHFLTHAYAKKLTNPAFSFDGGSDAGFLKRAGSSSSLNSMFSSEGDPHIRSCRECRKLLERRDEQVEQRNTKSTIVLLYEKLKACIRDCDDLLETFSPMVDSLSQGEGTTYNLQEAQRMRSKLVRHYEIIDQLSKRIAMLGLNVEEAPSAKQVVLQKSIRAYASNFMQENMMGLQSLPSEEQYERLQKRRTVEVQRRIALERQATLEAQEQERRQAERDSKVSSTPRDDDKRARSDSQKKQPPSASKTSASPSKGQPASGSKASSGSSKGWIPTESGVTSSSSDPMVQQMQIISSYIRQARAAEKWDEVNMLEQNLRDLQMEHSSQQKQTWS